MVALDKAARERGNLGWRRTTVAQRVFQKLSAGRFKERALTPLYALAEACAYRDRLVAGMTNAQLKTEDCAAAIVFVDSDLQGLYSVKLKPGDETKVLDKMIQINAVTVGLVIVIRDHERNGERMLKAIPFLKGERARQWLSEVLDREDTPSYVN